MTSDTASTDFIWNGEKVTTSMSGLLDAMSQVHGPTEALRFMREYSKVEPFAEDNIRATLGHMSDTAGAARLGEWLLGRKPAKETTIIDVTRAVIEKEGEGAEETLDLLGSILSHHAASADHFRSLQDGWIAEANAKQMVMRDGIAFALSQCPFGGMTSDYEYCLAVVRSLLHVSTLHPAYSYYLALCQENNGLAPVNYEVYPGFHLDLGY